MRAMAGAAAAIQADGLGVRYGKFQALADVSLRFDGRSVGLLGPNGAGKSTLIKTILGLIDPSAGRASVFGFDAVRDRVRLRRLIGYVPEKDCHIPEMSAIDYVTLGGELTGMSRTDAIQRAHEMLYFVGLGEARYRPVDGYSTGMKQRIKLAQALVHDPKLLLLDEPTNGLDPDGRASLLGILRDLSRAKGIRVLISSHLLRDIELVCDEVIVMARGQVVHHSSIDDLKHISDRHWRVRARADVHGDVHGFIGALTALGAKVASAGRETFSIELPEGAGTAAILRAAVEHGCQVRELLRQETSLEDAFIRTLSVPTAPGRP
jgi:ABC-2 type transport system ATP-binding protein